MSVARSRKVLHFRDGRWATDEDHERIKRARSEPEAPSHFHRLPAELVALLLETVRLRCCSAQQSIRTVLALASLSYIAGRRAGASKDSAMRRAMSYWQPFLFNEAAHVYLPLSNEYRREAGGTARSYRTTEAELLYRALDAGRSSIEDRFFAAPDWDNELERGVMVRKARWTARMVEVSHRVSHCRFCGDETYDRWNASEALCAKRTVEDIDSALGGWASHAMHAECLLRWLGRPEGRAVARAIDDRDYDFAGAPAVPPTGDDLEIGRHLSSGAARLASRDAPVLIGGCAVVSHAAARAYVAAHRAFQRWRLEQLQPLLFDRFAEAARSIDARGFEVAQQAALGDCRDCAVRCGCDRGRRARQVIAAFYEAAPTTTIGEVYSRLRRRDRIALLAPDRWRRKAALSRLAVVYERGDFDAADLAAAIYEAACFADPLRHRRDDRIDDAFWNAVYCAIGLDSPLDSEDSSSSSSDGSD